MRKEALEKLKEKAAKWDTVERIVEWKHANCGIDCPAWSTCGNQPFVKMLLSLSMPSKRR